MNRRELVKAAVGIAILNKTAVLGFDLRPSRRYVVFFDPQLTGKDFPATAKGFPPNTVFHSVAVPSGKTLDDAIRIYAS